MRVLMLNDYPLLTISQPTIESRDILKVILRRYRQSRRDIEGHHLSENNLMIKYYTHSTMFFTIYTLPDIVNLTDINDFNLPNLHL